LIFCRSRAAGADGHNYYYSDGRRLERTPRCGRGVRSPWEQRLTQQHQQQLQQLQLSNRHQSYRAKPSPSPAGFFDTPPTRLPATMSDFWVRKMKTYFQRIDFDKDGAITQKDFEGMAERFVKREKLDEVRGKELKTKLLQARISLHCFKHTTAVNNSELI